MQRIWRVYLLLHLSGGRSSTYDTASINAASREIEKYLAELEPCLSVLQRWLVNALIRIRIFASLRLIAISFSFLI